MSDLKRGVLGYRIDLENRDELRNSGYEPTVLLRACKDQLPKRNHIGKAFPLLKLLNQGNQGACQGHALALIFSICFYLMSGRVKNFSRAAAYYLSQKLDGISGDHGSTLSAGKKVAASGLCLEEDWPYPLRYDPLRPASATVDKFVYKLKTTKAFPKTEAGLQLMMEWLREGLPVQIGVFWNQSCDREVVTNYTWSNRDGGHSTVFWLFANENEVHNNNSWGLWNQDGIHSWTLAAVRQAFFCESNDFIGYAPDGIEVPDLDPITP